MSEGGRTTPLPAFGLCRSAHSDDAEQGAFVDEATPLAEPPLLGIDRGQIILLGTKHRVRAEHEEDVMQDAQHAVGTEANEQWHGSKPLNPSPLHL